MLFLDYFYYQPDTAANVQPVKTLLSSMLGYLGPFPFSPSTTMSSTERSTAIAADADQWSLSRSASQSTEVGLGTVSGRAILAVGELALRGIEAVDITVTLQRISSRLRSGGNYPGLVKDVIDLLELQRYVPYSVGMALWVFIWSFHAGSGSTPSSFGIKHGRLSMCSSIKGT